MGRFVSDIPGPENAKSKRRHYLADVGVADMDRVRFVWRNEDVGAIVRGANEHCAVSIDRDAWDAMGRPGKLLVSLTPVAE